MRRRRDPPGRSEIERLIGELIVGRNAQRDRALVRRRLIDGICYEPLANEVEQYVAPKAIPAYMVQNPNCCTNACGCGCGIA